MGYGNFDKFAPGVIQPYQPVPVNIPQINTGVDLEGKLSAVDAQRKAQEDAALKAGQFGMNMDTAKFGINSLSALGSLYTGLQGVKQAKASFNFQKDMANTNMAHQIQSYNTALGDRANARASQHGNANPSEVADYIKANQLTR